MTIKNNLFEYLDSQPERMFSGWGLFDVMYFRTGSKTMPETLLKYAREYADISGASFECLDKAKSKYFYKPGYKIAGRLWGRE